MSDSSTPNPATASLGSSADVPYLARQVTPAHPDLPNAGGLPSSFASEHYAEDSSGAQVVPEGTYTLTFPGDDLPEKYAKYFWSVIAVDRVFRRVLPNPLNKFLLNRESGLTYGNDGSLKLYFAPEKPADAPEGNWLPTVDKPSKLTFRFYGPRGAVADGTYFPPTLVKQ